METRRLATGRRRCPALVSLTLHTPRSACQPRSGLSRQGVETRLENPDGRSPGADPLIAVSHLRLRITRATRPTPAQNCQGAQRTAPSARQERTTRASGIRCESRCSLLLFDAASCLPQSAEVLNRLVCFPLNLSSPKQAHNQSGPVRADRRGPVPGWPVPIEFLLNLFQFRGVGRLTETGTSARAQSHDRVNIAEADATHPPRSRPGSGQNAAVRTSWPAQA